MGDLLNIGSSAIKAYSTAISAVSDNIANSQTPGYARRSATFSEGPGAGETALYRNAIAPGGVLVDGINRSVNEWLVEDSRGAASDAGETSTRLAWMEATEQAMDDGPSSVGNNLTEMFNTADQLSSNPSSEALRSSFLQSVDDVATSFRTTASRLESLADGISSQATATTNALNANITALHEVNVGLQSSRDGSTSQAGLLDERDRLLNEIASNVPITSEYNAKGAVTVRVNGPGSETLLSGTDIASVGHTAAADGSISYQLTPGGTFTPPAGALAGLSQASTHVAEQRSSLDNLADQFSANLNNAHQAGIDADGNAGQELLDDPGGAAALAAIALPTSSVAAADGASSNGNMLALSGLRGPGGAENGWANLIALQTQQVASTRSQDAASSTRQEGANAARDEVSGIDLDQEAADLLRFQQAYQGAARVLQVARENMQTILSSL